MPTEVSTRGSNLLPYCQSFRRRTQQCGRRSVHSAAHLRWEGTAPMRDCQLTKLASGSFEEPVPNHASTIPQDHLKIGPTLQHAGIVEGLATRLLRAYSVAIRGTHYIKRSYWTAPTSPPGVAISAPAREQCASQPDTARNANYRIFLPNPSKTLALPAEVLSTSIILVPVIIRRWTLIV